MYDEIDEDDEFIDDPISLIFDEFTKDNVQNSSKMYDGEEDVEDDPIILVGNSLETEIIDLRSSDDENEEQQPTLKKGYGNKNFVIPVTFLDFYRNVKLLKKCRPLSIKVVDCDKHPWYYGCYGTSKSRVNVNRLTLGKNSNIIKQEVEKADEDVCVENEKVNVEALPTSNQHKDNKIQDPGKSNHMVNGVTNPRKEVPITETRSSPGNEKLEYEIETAKKSKDLSQVDFKRNSGLVGLTITKKDFESNPVKITKKKTAKRRKKERNVSKQSRKQIGVALSNFGISETSVPVNSADNVLNTVTKDRFPNHVTRQDLSYVSPEIRDNVNNNTVSPTRCSLKITSAKILDKLKKAKVQDAPKTKSQQKAKNIFSKDQAIPKISLKRRPTTENDEFYVVDKEPRLSTPKKVSQSQAPQKCENTVDNIIQNNKPVEIGVTASDNRQKNSPIAPVIAEKLDQPQSCLTFPTPRSYHKKLKLKKSDLDIAPKMIENETTSSESKTRNNEAVNSSDCSLTSGLNQIVVSQVQSLRDLNTLAPTKPISKTPKKATIYIAKPKHLNLKHTKDIDTVTLSNSVNEKVLEGGVETTYDNKVKKTSILQPPSVTYLQVYNAHVANYHNSWQELSRKTKPKRTYSNEHKPDYKILKNTQKNATEQNQTNHPKNIITATNNNINSTNHDIPNRDTVTSDTNLNDTPIQPKPALRVQRFDNKQQGYFYMHNPNTQHNPTDINKFNPVKAQVYSLPGNNTVILRKPPSHIQTSTHPSLGLPIQTVLNHRPVKTPKLIANIPSPWSFPPPNTNVASNLPSNMPNTYMYPGHQMYPQYYWPPTNLGNPYPPPLVPQQDRNTNLIPVRNGVPNDSIIGSTANGELIKKINIAVPASDNTVVNDKQKMLDTLNNAINERNGSLQKPTDPRTTAKLKAKPCPLSKKPKTNPEPNTELSKGYSPPILPIPSFQKAIELVKMKQKVHDSLLRQVENMDYNVVNSNSKVDNYGHRTEMGAPKRKSPSTENKKQDKTKKISIEEYKKRAFKDGETNKGPKHKCKRKKVSKNSVVDNNQDLGYDSDATMKL